MVGFSYSLTRCGQRSLGISTRDLSGTRDLSLVVACKTKAQKGQSKDGWKRKGSRDKRGSGYTLSLRNAACLCCFSLLIPPHLCTSFKAVSCVAMRNYLEA